MTALELFAGCGGAALGLHRAGFTHVACVERHPPAAATLNAAGFPTIEADVRVVDFAAWRARADLLWASPPCQPGSSAGSRLGAADERDGWPATVAAIDACRPTWFLAENVLGWTYHADHSAGGGACPACHLDRVAGELARRFAFTGAWRLDAADLGVPQRRRRVILWGGPLPLDLAGPTPTHAHPGAAATLGRRPWVTMRDAIGDTLTRDSCDRRACYPCDDKHGRACGEPWRMDAPAPTVTTMDEKGTRANAGAGWTFNGGPDRASDAAFLVAGIRRIDIAAGLRLQGLPDDWPLQGTVHDRYVQVGNAVPPALAEACGRLVAGAHRAWSALRSSNVNHTALAGALRRHRLTVPAALGVAR
jgi:DNA (cytosine-5)-methyltransferase 1